MWLTLMCCNMVIYVYNLNRPAILGRKVQQTYYRGPGYFEIDVDIGCGNVLVQSILNVVRDKAKWLTVDLHFVIEGENEVSVH
jgi:Protein ENHANCED DISEASE RESISTANCE 2, C-terminal